MSDIDPHDAWVLDLMRRNPQNVSDPIDGDEGDSAVEPKITNCWYCGCEGLHTRDHQVPKSRGGSGRRENLVDACWPCNSKKRARTVEEYRRLLEKETGLPVVFHGERQ